MGILDKVKKTKISSADTLEAQQKIMKGIQERTYNNIEDELVEPDEPPIPDFSDEPDDYYVTEEWADARVKDAEEEIVKESNRGFIAFLIVGIIIVLLVLSAG